MTIPPDCLFYQAIELPGLGLVEGPWDHRGTENEYLGHFDFSGRRALDVGPANGFFSFEMERRGAQVTAIDLGPGGTWDAVPHAYVDATALALNLRQNVRQVENAFWFAHKALGSQVELRHAAAYDVPTVVESADVALMGNILQHLRDPFMAIQRVGSVVTDTMIVTETLWDDDPAFTTRYDMRLIPRIETPYVNHSWWQTSPSLVAEMLRLLGFLDVSVSYHVQRFAGTTVDRQSRPVKHFTVTGHRPGAQSRRDGPLLQVSYPADTWHVAEQYYARRLRWSSARRTVVQILNASTAGRPLAIAFGLASVHQEDRIEIYLNGFHLWAGSVSGSAIPLLLKGTLAPGANELEFLAGKEPISSSHDPRPLGFAVYDVIAWTERIQGSS